MTWRVRVTNVRQHCGGLRWTIIAVCEDYETVVTADATSTGFVFDLQSDEYAGSTGDEDLDDRVREYVLDLVSARRAHQHLDLIDRRRFGRVQMPCGGRRRWAA